MTQRFPFTSSTFRFKIIHSLLRYLQACKQGTSRERTSMTGSADELNRGYFDDMSELKQHGGKGMSDLLSAILFVMKDESESFWCFVALIERFGPNFNRDQNGMHSQLFALSKLVELLDRPLHKYFEQNDCLNYFFCFRWILIHFKRSGSRT
ncbi:hypothetical protein E1A91_A01G114700v1 [Gossypium mustelinum]|uniref:Rab-GAP TBC domain-containing protein n=1 Tax=Gossypium mustelinum TaxID=34275 RepID=A0A5D3AC14_GOSMU|nr:hypothetical protein E1A91_A01G114700v1 [Gossypium mustelinum]